MALKLELERNWKALGLKLKEQLGLEIAGIRVAVRALVRKKLGLG